MTTRVQMRTMIQNFKTEFDSLSNVFYCVSATLRSNMYSSSYHAKVTNLPMLAFVYICGSYVGLTVIVKATLSAQRSDEKWVGN